jgi:hypothetical protein
MRVDDEEAFSRTSGDILRSRIARNQGEVGEATTILLPNEHVAGNIRIERRRSAGIRNSDISSGFPIGIGSRSLDITNVNLWSMSQPEFFVPELEGFSSQPSLPIGNENQQNGENSHNCGGGGGNSFVIFFQNTSTAPSVEADVGGEDWTGFKLSCCIFAIAFGVAGYASIE